MADSNRFGNFIDGAWLPAADGETFENRNPADQEELIGRFAESGEEDLRRAIESARKAFPEWRATPAPKRGEILFRAGQLLQARKEEIACDMTREMGKVLVEARGDVQEAIDMAFWMGGEGRRLYGITTPSELKNKFNLTMRAPLGVCGLITPWNFPVAIPSWKAFPALVAGNTCVLKPSPHAPLSAVHFVRMLEEAGLPPGVLNLVTGTHPKLGATLVEHPDVRVISFTGSTSTGSLVAQACAREFKRYHLEMGGKNVIIVLDDADLDLAVDGALWGGFGTSGQRCTASSRIVVHRRVYKSFLRRFVKRAKQLRVGNGLEPKTEMGPVISRQQMESILEWIEFGKAEGALLVTGGSVLDRGPFRRGHFLQPTVFAEVEPGMRIAQEEIFGPVVAVIPSDSFSESLEIANAVQYGLSSSIYTRDISRAFVAMQEMDTGIVYVNSPTIGAETHLPFGGTKQTGNGHREAADTAFDVFTEWKTVYVDFSGRLQKAQID